MAAVTRALTPGGPATRRGRVRRRNWPSRIMKGKPPKWSPCRCESTTHSTSEGSTPARFMAMSEEAPQSISRLPAGSPLRCRQVCKRPPLPRASPEPRNRSATDATGRAMLHASLAIRALGRDLAPAEGQDVAALHLVACPVPRRAGGEPLDDGVVRTDEVTDLIPPHVRNAFEHVGEKLSESGLADHARAPGLFAERGLEDHVVRHHAQNAFEVVPVPHLVEARHERVTVETHEAPPLVLGGHSNRSPPPGPAGLHRVATGSRQSPISTAARGAAAGWARVSATGSRETTSESPALCTCTTYSGPGAGAGKSWRQWAPRLSCRSSALAMISRATVA